MDDTTMTEQMEHAPGDAQGIDAEWRPELATAPLYLQVAHHLEARIRSGEFPVGSLLPTENELAAALGVSRQTVRQAIATMRTGGRLSARKGVGTRVEAGMDVARRHFIAHSRSELFEVASNTEFVISHRREISAQGKLAVELGCRPGRRFLHMTGVRYTAARQKAFSWNEVYIDARLAPAVKDVEVAKSAIFHLIEEYTGEMIHEIQQDIKPVALAAEVAEQIGCREGDLALQVTRRYYGSGRRLIEYAFQILPADRFTYTTTLRAET
ncbi:DNA-binding transcriptional regulator, GntR family [Rhizobium sp. RU35A]|uniref:GntR family transcriptional regulator n=1 Tax=Rhizobium straminoryzae TaxID=1387186 RepID=A0A549TA19_9HYPH|nr:MULTISPECIES: GntR family transcriptional regulator [Rhizobium]TRL38713.1 GntR family transcriptional regulator [Rhizobium straminoryzae]SIQ37186.1 DNA-binding transcriptional regulator, GntR family [Rhizobium sp. RU35A]